MFYLKCPISSSNPFISLPASVVKEIQFEEGEASDFKSTVTIQCSTTVQYYSDGLTHEFYKIH